jgi:2-amino-4-hydroxy-6-hydroxymethyldihydropteridine diphosphokinase
MDDGETAWLMENEFELPRDALDVVIGLGANLGSPQIALGRAVSDLGRLGELVAVSALYRTSPVGGPPQPDFLNAAARLRFTGAPTLLLERLLEIERARGRVRHERWGPRCLDLDILWLKGQALVSAGLEIPHPRLRERAFALRPLLDVAPEASDPRDGLAYARILAELGCSGVEQLAQSWVLADPEVVSRGMDRPGR